MHIIEILVIDSDPAHASRIDVLLGDAHRVDRIAHDVAVAHISREDMSRYAAVIVALTDDASTLSDMYRMGAYVLLYIAQLCPEVLPRVIVMTPEAKLAGTAPPLTRVLIEPVTDEQLLAAVRAASV